MTQNKVTRLRVGDRVRVGLHTEMQVLDITDSGRVVLRWSSEADSVTILTANPDRKPDRPWRKRATHE